MTIPTLDNRTPESTKVVLHRFGNDYFFDKIWIQGKNYGYEFPLPDSVKAREKESLAAVTVPARYEATQATTETTQQTAAAEPAPAPAAREEVREETVIAQNTTPEPTPAPEPSANREEPAPAPQSLPATSADWLMMLLSGGTLSGAGLMLRRKW
jgi:hypothetical protein